MEHVGYAVCSLMIEDLPEGNLQGVYPLDTARLGVVHEDVQEMVDVIHHHHAEIHMIEIIRPKDIRQIEGGIHLQGGGFLQIEEQIRLKEDGTHQIEEGSHRIREIHQSEGVGHQLEKITLHEGTRLKENPLHHWRERVMFLQFACL